ncbi:hypothetical protein GF374_01355, partial [Candidatus Woesearchaeota archaeon]|nr:hypothetical protein [Candidatus Woesearchaeota archaeon]
MLKLAIISDLHLGFAYGTERGEDAFKNAEKAFNLALKEEPNLILLGGDIFHDKIPRPEILGRTIELFTKINKSTKANTLLLEKTKNNETKELKKVIPSIICIWGTHERRHAQSTNPVQILQKAGLLYSLHAESILVEAGYDKIGLHGLSGVPETYAKEALKSWSPQPFKDATNILMLHQNFKELLPVDEGLTYGDLPKGFNLFILGHIHWKSESKHPATNTPILIPGSTIATQLTQKESQKDKGIHIIELSRQKGNIDFIPISTRPLFYEKIKVSGERPNEISVKIMQKINEILTKKHKQKPMLRIKLQGILAEGFSPSDLSVNSIIKDYKDKLILNIDKSKLTSTVLERQSQLLAELKEKKLTIDQLGLNLLIKNLKTNLEKEKLESIFNLLADG